MAALILALALNAGLGVEVSGCGADAATLGRLVLLEWPAPPEGTRVTAACDDAGWRLAIEAPGHQPILEAMELPQLMGSARMRVLALIIAERGRGLQRALPQEAPIAIEAPRAPLVATRTGQTTTAEVQPEPPSTPLRGALLGSRDAKAWRVSVSATSQRPFSIGPFRFGPELRVQRGPIAVLLSSTVGRADTAYGAITAYAVTAEPELTVACLSGRRAQLCAAARGVFGYGAIDAGSVAMPGLTTKSVNNAVLGGAASLAFSFALGESVSVDLDARAGWQWAVNATAVGEPAAGLGGFFAAVSLGLAAAWGKP